MPADRADISDAVLADALREAPIGVTLADARADDYPLVYVNEAFERITGYDEAEVIGRNCRFLQGPDTDPEKPAAFREALAAAEPVTVELLNYRKDGTPFWNLVDIAPVERDGEVTHYVGFQQDVTDRVEAEEELSAERAELELLNRVVHHDIRNDMMVVSGWAEHLAGDLDGEASERARRIRDRAQHVTDLTETVGDLVDALAGDADLSLTAVPLAPVVRDETAVARETYGDTRDLTVRVEDVPDVAVVANQMLSSVVGNLLSNAIRHNPADDPTVVVSCDVADDWVTLRVSDDGPGIPPERRDAVFARGERDLGSPGTGLGLYLVDKLVSGYGGEVHVEEADLGGAAFVVRLRRA